MMTGAYRRSVGSSKTFKISVLHMFYGGWFDFRGRLWCSCGSCSRSQASFLKHDAGDPNSSESRTGRTKPGNRFQGHFQGQARQLISQAFGRAILWISPGEVIMVTPLKISKAPVLCFLKREIDGEKLFNQRFNL